MRAPRERRVGSKAILDDTAADHLIELHGAKIRGESSAVQQVVGNLMVDADCRPVSLQPSLPLARSSWTAIAGELRLSGRQTEIVRGVLDNLDVDQIAAKLQIKPRTVRAHVEKVYKRLGLRNRCELVLLVFAVHLARDPDESRGR